MTQESIVDMVEAMGIEPMSATHQNQSATCLVIVYTVITLSITKKCNKVCYSDCYDTQQKSLT